MRLGVIVCGILLAVASTADAGPLLCRTPLGLRISDGGLTVVAVYRGLPKAAGPHGSALEPGTCAYTDSPGQAGQVPIRSAPRFQPLANAYFIANQVQPTLNGTYAEAGRAAAYGYFLASTELILRILVEHDLVLAGLGTGELAVEPYAPPPPISRNVINERIQPDGSPRVVPKPGG